MNITKHSRRFLSIAALLAGVTITTDAGAAVYITEWQYNGSEFIEFTNMGPAAQDMTGWSFDDDSRTPGTVSLSAFGTVQPGESVILAEATADAFRTSWGLDGAIKVIGGNATNLGRADEINLYDQGGALIDRLTYGDLVFVGSIRTDVNSGGPTSDAVLGTNNVLNWAFSNAGGNPHGVTLRTFGSFQGTPGAYVPEPACLGTFAGAALLLGARRRRA